MNQDSLNLIALRLPMLCSTLSKKYSPGLLESWQRHLDRFDPPVIKRAFDRMERDLQRWPSLASAMQVCREEMRGQHIGLRFERGVGKDPETGLSVIILRDLHDEGKELFKADDCPEGREFLRLLHSL